MLLILLWPWVSRITLMTTKNSVQRHSVYVIHKAKSWFKFFNSKYSLKEQLHYIMKKITRAANLITGRQCTTSHCLQISNYYTLHCVENSLCLLHNSQQHELIFTEAKHGVVFQLSGVSLPRRNPFPIGTSLAVCLCANCFAQNCFQQQQLNAANFCFVVLIKGILFGSSLTLHALVWN